MKLYDKKFLINGNWMIRSFGHPGYVSKTKAFRNAVVFRFQSLGPCEQIPPPPKKEIDRVNNLPLSINRQTQAVRPACTMLKLDWLKTFTVNK